MTIEEYLALKYQVEKPTTLTRREQEIFGMPRRLRSGWLSVFGQTELTKEALEKLAEVNRKRLKNTTSEKSKLIAQSGLDAALCGLKTGQWAPRLRPEANDGDFLRSYEWRRVRMMALKKYGARCQCCGITPAQGATLHVDHIKPRRLFPQLALDVTNLQVLCEECNHGKGNWDMTDWREPVQALTPDQDQHMRDILRLQVE